MFGKKIRDGNEPFLHRAPETLPPLPEGDEEGWSRRSHGLLVPARFLPFIQDQRIIMIYWIRLPTHT